MLCHSFLLKRSVHGVKRVWRRSSASGRWVNSLAYMMEMVWKRFEINGSWASAVTALTWVEQA